MTTALCQFCGPGFLGTCPHQPMRSAASDSDRFHIPPQVDIGKTNVDATLANQRAQLEAYQSKRGPLGEGMTPIEAAKQPVMAMSVIDLKPLIGFFAAELQRTRDQLAVERTAASSAREALAACEARCKAAPTSQPDTTRLPYPGDAARTARELGKLEARYAQRCDRNAQLRVANVAMRQERDAAIAARDEALKQLEHARCDAKDAQQMLMDERARFERSLSELRSSATEQTVSLVPGSTAAVIEAYRLLVGDTLEWKKPIGWYDNAKCDIEEMETATYQLIRWLDKHAPGGKP